mgnify:CR=1 FL=1
MRHTCGAQIEPGAIMCACGEMIIDDGGSAGAALEVAAVPPRQGDSKTAQAPVSCPRCGREVAPEQSHCSFCDAWLGGIAMSPEVSGRVLLALPDGSVVAVDSGELPLGRLSPDERIARAVDFDGVSRRHALLIVEPHRVRVRDLGSMNGTWVGGRRVEGEWELDAGEVEVGLGAHVVLRVTVGDRERREGAR